MPVTNWNTTTINGVQYLVIDVAQLRIPLNWDPNSNVFIAVAAPGGGVANFPALVKGDPGDTPDLDEVIDFTPLEPDDPTPDSASFTPLGSNLYQLVLKLHKGAKGDDGTLTIMSATDLVGAGSATPGQILVVNATADGFVFGSLRIGDRWLPATIRATPSGNPAYTLCSVTISAQTFDWRPAVRGQCIIAGTGSDVAVDLIARLSNSNPDGGETTGNEVGRAFGVPGAGPINQMLNAGPPAGSADSYDRVPKGQIATVFFRAERQTGADTFTTSAATSRFSVKVEACPTDV